MLLRLERVHLDRHFRRRHHVGQEDEAPAAQLRAVAEVEVLGQRVVLPSAGVGDRFTPPHARGPVEVEEAAAAAARRLLEQQMAVQEHGLHPREQ